MSGTVVHVRLAMLAALFAIAAVACPFSAAAEDESVALELHCTDSLRDKHGLALEEMELFQACVTYHQASLAQVHVYVSETQIPEWKRSVGKGYPANSWVEVVTASGVVLKSRATTSDWDGLDRAVSRAVERCMDEYGELREQGRGKAPLSVYNL